MGSLGNFWKLKWEPPSPDAAKAVTPRAPSFINSTLDRVSWSVPVNMHTWCARSRGSVGMSRTGGVVVVGMLARGCQPHLALLLHVCPALVKGNASHRRCLFAQHVAAGKCQAAEAHRQDLECTLTTQQPPSESQGKRTHPGSAAILCCTVGRDSCLVAASDAEKWTRAAPKPSPSSVDMLLLVLDATVFTPWPMEEM